MKLISLDISNLYYTIKNKYPGKKLNYEKYFLNCHQICNEPLYKAIAYGASIRGQANGFKEALKHLGCELRYKEPKQFANCRKADWDVGIAIDIVDNLKYVNSVVLGSADSDMVPVINHIHNHNKRCYIYACRISSELKEVADGYYEICSGELQ